MTEGSIECCLTFIPLANMDQVVSATEVELGKGPLKGSESNVEQRQRVSVADGARVQTLIIDTCAQRSVLLLTKKNPAPTGEEEGWIIPDAKDSERYLSIASHSGWERLYNLLPSSGELARSSTAHS